jgi:hypothetical protein
MAGVVVCGSDTMNVGQIKRLLLKVDSDPEKNG